jgi:hypothetical protein
VSCQGGEGLCSWVKVKKASLDYNHSSLDFEGRIWLAISFSFEAPLSIQTALALRLAIWRQEDARWQVCGILQSNRETCG